MEYSVPNAIILKNFGGREMTEYMIKNLLETGYNFYTPAEKEIAKDIKKELVMLLLIMKINLKILNLLIMNYLMVIL